LVEFTNRRTINSINQEITIINSLTGGHPTAAMLPVSYETDREVLDAALPTTGLAEPENVRVVHISDTLHLGELLISDAYQQELEGRDDLEIIDGPSDMEFDSDDNLYPVSAALSHVVAE
jgi:hypothetical protein